MVEEVATGSLGPRSAMLSDSRDEFFGLKPLQDSEDGASRGTGLFHERSDRRVAREILVCLIRKENEYEPHRRRADAYIVAQSRAFQLMLAVWSKVSRGRPRWDALSYAASCLAR